VEGERVRVRVRPRRVPSREKSLRRRCWFCVWAWSCLRGWVGGERRGWRRWRSWVGDLDFDPEMDGRPSSVADRRRRFRPRSRLLFDVALFAFRWARFEAAVGFLPRRSSSPPWEMSTGSRGRSFLSTDTFAIASSTCCPPTTWPKTVCLPFRCGHGARVMKNLLSWWVR